MDALKGAVLVAVVDAVLVVGVVLVVDALIGNGVSNGGG
jgi:hypothetical protein